MKVRFEFTHEDLIDSAERSLSRSRAIRSMRWRSRLTTGLLCGLIVYFMLEGTAETKLLWAAAVALLVVAIHPLLLASARKRNLLKVFRERFAGQGPFVCEVELTPSGVVTNQVGTQSVRPWAQIAEVNDAPDSVEIVSREGLIVVRNRAFRTAEERLQFLETARGYTSAAAGGRSQ